MSEYVYYCPELDELRVCPWRKRVTWTIDKYLFYFKYKFIYVGEL
jgi:hypothetical protein